MKILRAAGLRSNFTGSFKKRVYFFTNLLILVYNGSVESKIKQITFFRN